MWPPCWWTKSFGLKKLRMLKMTATQKEHHLNVNVYQPSPWHQNLFAGFHKLKCLNCFQSYLRPTSYFIFIYLMINPNPTLSIFPVGGNRRIRRKPTTFDRELWRISSRISSYKCRWWNVLWQDLNSWPPCWDAIGLTIGSFSKHDGDVLRNKRIVHTKQRERIISSPLINNVLVL